MLKVVFTEEGKRKWTSQRHFLVSLIWFYDPEEPDTNSGAADEPSHFNEFICNSVKLIITTYHG